MRNTGTASRVGGRKRKLGAGLLLATVALVGSLASASPAYAFTSVDKVCHSGSPAVWMRGSSNNAGASSTLITGSAFDCGYVKVRSHFSVAGTPAYTTWGLGGFTVTKSNPAGTTGLGGQHTSDNTSGLPGWPFITGS